jgi:hypothetical protein
MAAEQRKPRNVPSDSPPAPELAATPVDPEPAAPPPAEGQTGSQPQPPPDPTAQPASEPTIVQAIAYAWHRFNSYDNQSNDLKNRYQRVRRLIIFASFLTTLLAILSALSDFRPIIQVLFIGMGILLFAVAIRLWFYDATPPAPPAPLQGRERVWRNLYRLIRWGGVLVFGLAGGGVWLLSALFNGMVVWPEGMAALGSIFQIALVALPLASAGLLAFASRFEAGNAWVTYRIASETIKRAVYTLRVRRSLEEIQVKHLIALHDTVSTAQQIIQDSGVITPFDSAPRNLNSELIKPSYVDVPAHDDGYGPLTLAQYIDWRLTPQANWYRMRIREQYPAARRYRAMILFVGAVGALLAALGLGEFVAVSVAGVTALTAYLSLQQYEQNYGIYSHTIARLEDTTVKHSIRAGAQENAKAQMAFVESIEEIMADERAYWRIAVLQGQNTTEETLNKLVSTHSTSGPNFRRLAGLQPEEEEEGEGEAPGELPPGEPAGG